MMPQELLCSCGRVLSISPPELGTKLLCECGQMLAVEASPCELTSELPVDRLTASLDSESEMKRGAIAINTMPDSVDSYVTLAEAERTKLSSVVFIMLFGVLLLANANRSPVAIGMAAFLFLLAALAFRIRRTPLRIERNSTHIRFSSVLLAWSAPREKIVGLNIIKGKLCFTFSDDAPLWEKGKFQLDAHARKHGYQFAWLASVFPPDGLLRLVDDVNCESTNVKEHALNTKRFAETNARRVPHAYVTIAVILINIFIFGLVSFHGGTGLANMIEWGANYQPLVAFGEWWRLLSSVFLHFSVPHLIVNCWVLWGIGKLRALNNKLPNLVLQWMLDFEEASAYGRCFCNRMDS